MNAPVRKMSKLTSMHAAIIMCTLRAVPAVGLGQRAELKGADVPTVHAHLGKFQVLEQSSRPSQLYVREID